MADAVANDPLTSDPMRELEAMQAVHKALAFLPPDGRRRVIAWVIGALQVDGAANPQPPVNDRPTSQQRLLPVIPAEEALPAGYATFADLFSAAAPKTNAEKALVGGYWLQVCQGAESFVSMAVNNELKNLGEGVDNITSAFDGLKEGKPQLALQVRKDGKSQQARKRYKLTVAGIRTVDVMIREDRNDG